MLKVREFHKDGDECQVAGVTGSTLKVAYQ